VYDGGTDLCTKEYVTMSQSEYCTTRDRSMDCKISASECDRRNITVSCIRQSTPSESGPGGHQLSGTVIETEPQDGDGHNSPAFCPSPSLAVDMRTGEFYFCLWGLLTCSPTDIRLQQHPRFRVYVISGPYTENGHKETKLLVDRCNFTRTHEGE